MLSRHVPYLNAGDYRRLQILAREEGRTAAELVREAVSEYTRRRTRRSRPRSLGAGRSGQAELAERSEDLLTGFGREP